MRKLEPKYMILEGPTGNRFITSYGTDLTWNDRETGETGKFKLLGLVENFDDARTQLDDMGWF